MSFRTLLSSLNTPPVVATAGLTVLSGLSMSAPFASTLSMAALQGLNTTAFLINVGAVSVPGRIDGQQDYDMRKGSLNPDKPGSTGQSETTPLGGNIDTYSPSRGRTLVSPSGWAFAIWGPIYIGELCFVAGQFLPGSGLETVLPQITMPFVAANLFQSLWCASFRPYYEGWGLMVSPLMLAGTAFSLSQVHTVACSAAASGLGWFFLPLTMHFGWTTAATLVNLNGSIAEYRSLSDSTVIAAGHASALAASVLGVGLTLAQSSSGYGLTLAWALSACADGMRKRISNTHDAMPRTVRTGADVQSKLCAAGALACCAASLYISIV